MGYSIYLLLKHHKSITFTSNMQMFSIIFSLKNTSADLLVFCPAGDLLKDYLELLFKNR
jgi:hypothetical protein